MVRPRRSNPVYVTPVEGFLRSVVVDGFDSLAYDAAGWMSNGCSDRS